MEVKISLKFVCSKCNTEIKHDYTQNDVFNRDALALKCQNCGYSETIKTKTLIDKAQEEAIKEMKKGLEQAGIKVVN